MKNSLRTVGLVFLLLVSLVVYAQPPQAFKYKGIPRDQQGKIIHNSDISLQISILTGHENGAIAYQEQHYVKTNAFGVVNLDIGRGEVSLGNFSTIDWGADDHYLKIEVDHKGGDNFVNSGVAQLLSVPYALYAGNVGNTDDADADPTNELQDISLSGTDLSLSDGSTVDLSVLPDAVDDADADPTNELQDLALSGDALTLSNDATPVDLAKYLDNTDEQQLSLTGQELTIAGGNTITLPDAVDDADADPTNELQDIALSGTDLSLSDGSTIDLSVLPDAVDDADADPTNELQDLGLTGDALSLSDDATPVDLAKYLDNTDGQQLSLSGQELSIAGGNTVTLPDAVDDADADPANELQDIALSGTDLSLTSGSTIDLSVLPDAVDDADADPTNELQDLGLTGDALSLSDDATPVDLAKYLDNTDGQQLSLSGQELSIAGGNTVTLPDAVDDADADPINELQDISLSGTDLSISDGSTIDLSVLPDAVDDTDADPTNELQDLGLTGDALTLSDDATPVDLAENTLDNTDGQQLSLSGQDLSIAGGNTVTLPDAVDDADADPTNELQDLGLTGDALSLSDDATPVDLAKYLDNTDGQQLSLSGQELSIAGGNTVTLPDAVDDADADPTNEIQTLSLSGNTLSLSDGGSVTLPLGSGGGSSGGAYSAIFGATDLIYQPSHQQYTQLGDLAVEITLATAGEVLITYHAPMVPRASGQPNPNYITAVVEIDGVMASGLGSYYGTANNTGWIQIKGTAVIHLEAGTHQIRLMYSSDGGFRNLPETYANTFWGDISGRSLTVKEL